MGSQISGALDEDSQAALHLRMLLYISKNGEVLPVLPEDEKGGQLSGAQAPNTGRQANGPKIRKLNAQLPHPI